MQTFTDALGLTTRSLSTVELDGAPAHRQVLTRTFPTDADDLWTALTDPERIPRWFLPITGDLREGGHYQLEGNAGGVIDECDRPRRFRITWGMGGPPSWVTVTLTPSPDGTSTAMELEHLGHVPDQMWQQFGPSATGIGWDMALLGLGMHVESGRTIDPAEAAAIMTSPEGGAFMEGSAELWREADVAVGTDPQDAATRAAYTVAVYTGQAEPPSPPGAPE